VTDIYPGNTAITHHNGYIIVKW